MVGLNNQERSLTARTSNKCRHYTRTITVVEAILKHLSTLCLVLTRIMLLAMLRMHQFPLANRAEKIPASQASVSACGKQQVLFELVETVGK